MKRNILVLLIFFTNIISFGQNIKSINGSLLFSKGIFLQNLKTLIPWEIKYIDLKNYGNPNISPKPKHSSIVQLKWDSVEIINNFKVNLFTEALKRPFFNNKVKSVIEFRSLLDSTNYHNLASFLVIYTGKNGNFIKNKKVCFTRWIIDGCKITIGEDNHFGYFLTINKMEL